MIKIETMVGDRYEILEKVGTGGMSDVYKAKDHKLNRFVAVKVLKQEFSENANFVSKFRVEAQAAAILEHSNIVNVYDVGEEDGYYYIVMELVEGITLKKYIEKKARLPVKEAISIAIQVAMGIDAAHSNHIIHRDIKPQNIIISKDGKVKVTDFGIAKAATSNTITSNVMGSVHYTSPEQARGGYSDERSDIYSLGISMFEMLTGYVPFNGETTVAIAIKHIQEEMPSLREYIPDVPYSVEQIVLKCCKKSPEMRYQSMGELLSDLKQALMDPDGDFVRQVDMETRSGAGTRVLDEEDMANIRKKSQHRQDIHTDEYDEWRDERNPRKRRPRPSREEVYDYTDDPQNELPVDDDGRMDKITTVLAIVVAVVIGLIIIFLVGKWLGIFDGSGEDKKTPQATEEEQGIMMISVTGTDVTNARQRLVENGFESEITYVDSSQYPEGTVMEQSVEAGTLVARGTMVNLTVSAGTNGKTVPSVSGMSEAEASNILKQEGFVVSVTKDPSAEVEAGRIIYQNPAGETKAPAGSAVTIHVSTGVENAKSAVPELYGKSREEAEALLTQAGLRLGTVNEVNNDEVQEGLVCYQSYAQGSYVDPETYIDIRISLGPEAATYYYNSSITGPSVSEDPSYKEGSRVEVVLKTDDESKELLHTETTSFPLVVNFIHIPCPTGTLTLTYSVTLDGTTTIGENGETITVPGETVFRTISRPIQFTQE